MGTTSPTKEELQKMPHRMVGILEANQSINAKEYSLLATQVVDKIRAQGKIPILTAGTGFYLKAFLYGMYPVPSPTQEVKNYVQSLPPESLVEELRKKDPEALNKISKNDYYRYKRALELAMSGILFSHLGKERVGGYLEDRKIQNYQGYWIIWDRKILYQRIEERAKNILLPMAEEAKKVEKEYGRDCPALKTLGYNFALDFIHGKIKIESFYSELVRAHRLYAKKQTTWFRKQPDLKPVTWNELLEILKQLQNIKKE